MFGFRMFRFRFYLNYEQLKICSINIITIYFHLYNITYTNIYSTLSNYTIMNIYILYYA